MSVQICGKEEFASLSLQQISPPPPQPKSREVTLNITKGESLSNHENTNTTTVLSRSSTRNSRSSDVASSVNRNSMASSNDGDGSEDEVIRDSERNRARKMKHTSWHRQTRGREELLNKVRESDDDDNQAWAGNNISYVEQLRGRQSSAGSERGSRYETKIRRHESGSESNSSTHRMSRSAKRSTSETRDNDGYLHPPTSTRRRSLQSSSNRNSGASYSA